jgi:hypothetical protein
MNPSVGDALGRDQEHRPVAGSIPPKSNMPEDGLNTKWLDCGRLLGKRMARTTAGVLDYALSSDLILVFGPHGRFSRARVPRRSS